MSRIKKLTIVILVVAVALLATGCTINGNHQDIADTRAISENLVGKYPTPSDINTSLSRYNLIRRAYFLAGDVEKAKNLPCDVEKPLGYLYLFVEGVGCVMCDSVDGVVTSMRSYLTPDSVYYSSGSGYVNWVADIDGTYGENPDGIFWFDANGMYHEWTGLYYYSDTYYELDDPILNIVVEVP